jgi:hypothetical protein
MLEALTCSKAMVEKTRSGPRVRLPRGDGGAGIIENDDMQGDLRQAPIGRMLHEGTGTPALHGCWNHRMSRACFAFLALIAIFMKPAEAGQTISRLLDRSSLATAYSSESDLVTAYTTGMARSRLTLAGRAGDTNLAVPLEPSLLRAEFRARTWRAADGSLLQGFTGSGGFRLTVGNCVARICAASECSDAGWPVYRCSDGRKRRISVTNFATAIFDGVSYRRLMRPSRPAHGR